MEDGILMEKEFSIPEKVYIYVSQDDVICECTLQTHKLGRYSGDLGPYYEVTYSSPSYSVEFIIDNENWEKEYDDEGLCIFRNYQDVVNERSFIVTKNYSTWLKRLHSPPNYEK